VARKLMAWFGGMAVLVAVLALVGCAVSTVVPVKVTKHPDYVAGTACDAADCHDEYKHEEPYLGPCEGCHSLDKWKPSTYSHKDTTFDNGMHPLIGCAMCHTEGEPLPTGGCVTCHDAPHVDTKKCETCHTTTAWGMRKALPSNHVSLLGGHSELECFDCHTAKTPAKPRACVDCHGTNHGGLRNCQDCHEPATGWEPKDGWEHDSFFKITGKHKALDCTDCHENGRFAGTPKVCVGCHGKKHGGLTNCASCHTTAGFKPSSFRHSSVFALTGRHAKIDCTKCHARREYAKVIGNGSHRCVDCHGPQHGGLTNCASCHTTAGFEDATFNHAAKFPLIGEHATLACSKCHIGGEFVVEGTNCVDCHGTNHGGQTRCQDCHTPAGWSPTKTIVHPAASVPLGGTHADTSRCTRCHPGNVFSAAVTPCSTCHDAPHVAPTDCLRCHVPTVWTAVSFSHPEISGFGVRGVHQSDSFGTYPSGCFECHPGTAPDPDFSAYSCTAAGCHQ